MKNFKKLAGIMLALVMVLAMAVPAFAATETGSIEITSPVKDQTYNIYKMFDLVSYNTTSGAYSYTVATGWESFITTGEGKNYFKVEDGLVKIQDTVDVSDDSVIAEIAKAALAYVKTVNGDDNADNNIPVAATLPNADSYKATGLDLGYYLVDSSLGALCGLTTTDPDVTVKEKNGTPTVEKTVDKATANIGDTVNFTTTITVQDGAENYVLHDKMDATLALKADTIKVQVGGADVDATNYTKTIATADSPLADSCTFEIKFENDYVKTLAEGTTITVTYSAALTADAVAGEANKNDTYLKYGDNNKTTNSATKTYTYSFGLVKTDKDKKVLSGAEFALYDAKTGGKQIDLVKVSDGKYRVATPEDKSATGFASAVIEVGQATITGLANGTYWLEETKQPAGYNKLTNRVSVTIADANNSAIVMDNKWVEGGLHVENFTGTELPSTGGIGTMIFYIVGGVLLVGAGVLLVVRKRMSAEKKTK